jgi:hypothetical protein
MPEFDTYVDVDVDEFISACSKGEIKKLIDSLIEDGHIINSNSIIVPSKKNSLMEIEHIETCNKLSSVYLRMNREDWELIKQIASKY